MPARRTADQGSRHLATILVVDDIPTNQKLLRETLEPEGYEVLLASEGATALEVAQAALPDLVLLDVQMPGLDGFETCRRLKQTSATSDIPVLFITANDDSESLTTAFKTGAVDFVTKPFRREEVLVRIETHLKIHRLSRSLAQKNRELQASLQQTEAAKQRLDELLHVILPHEVVEELKATHQVRPRRLDRVAVLFSDIVGFTSYCDQHGAEEVHLHLQRLVATFEQIALDHGLEKIKTIGDSFMAIAHAAAAPEDAAIRTVRCGLALIEAAQTQPPNWALRVGVHVGPVSAGVVGHRKYQFDVWGDTVNTAKRMQEAAQPGKVCVASSIWPSLVACTQGQSQGRINVKGKGEIELISVESVCSRIAAPVASNLLK
jgi:adenylate cyclase